MEKQLKKSLVSMPGFYRLPHGRWAHVRVYIHCTHMAGGHMYMLTYTAHTTHHRLPQQFYFWYKSQGREISILKRNPYSFQHTQNRF